MPLYLALCLTSAALAAPPDATSFLPPSDVHLGGWLGHRFDVNARQRLLKVDEPAILDGFRHRPGKHPWIGEHAGKFLHAAVLTWANTGDPALKAKLDRVARTLIACQEDDGYLGTYARDQRWSMTGETGWDVWSHKYNLFGLLAYWQYTRDPAALNCCRRMGDLLLRTFGPGRGQLNLMEHSTHLGMASSSVLQPMVMLYRATGDRRYLDWCRYVVSAWETAPGGPKLVSSLLAGKGVNQTANGKAYEMMSCLTGAVDLARALLADGQRDEADRLLAACRHAWDDIAAHRLYITGGTSLNECFQPDDNLANTGNVSETCAVVTLEQLSLELFRLRPEAKYMDVVERAVYNHLLGAQQPENGDFSYYTPLEGGKPYTPGLNCCVSSGPRGIALLPTFAATLDDDGSARLNLYSEGTLAIPDKGLRLTIHTRYPFEPVVTLLFDKAPRRPFTLRLRSPGWLGGDQMLASLPTNERTSAPSGSYLDLRRHWLAGDKVVLLLPMPLRVVPGEGLNRGKLAVCRGPLVLSTDSSQLAGIGSIFRAATVAFEDADRLVPTIRPLHADDPGLNGGAKFEVPGVVLARGHERRGLSLPLVPYADAGASGGRFAVWLPRPSEPPVPVPLFTREQWSREGNVPGSICDGDPGSFRVTFNGTKREEDWFAVFRDEPLTVQKVVFVQGRLFHDGGWWDCSGGKPRLEYQAARDAPWRPLGELAGYPNATATDPRGVREGQVFELRLPVPVSVVAVRIIGRPACGDSPQQAFAGCAELTPEP